ncbi:tryptophan--tRNA ligase [Bacteriovorax sp. DB6_IX]|uniref:tryptophan--tRNA ligase n=1 Tax=Bacteriovorax sp. DB6_IX TaxID=1353530 RepID=UPI000389DF74|nr:tryptophan--tRNA ligase [Bacteriovorax sp. DB6_IX]EQC52135.1 tryptophan--tRNA ligase [Bacteriovorax sp. DB6_IX]
MSKQTLLSASTATGNLTLGNYIGAINNWTKLQEQYDCFYMVADLHALTVKQDPKQLQERSLSFYAQYLALGLDPEKNTVFMQSHVSEHSELAWILNCMTPMGNLNRMTQFKEKSLKNSKNINAGLFTYPVLMAADILLYQTHLVPVGEDQKQHLELARDIVTFFANRYGDTFTMPEAYIGKVGARVMSLQEPTSKMSKSDDNEKAYVSIIDTPKKIQKKIKGAVTDTGTVVSYDKENKPGISNLMTIYSVLSGMSMDEITAKFEGKMYGHLKVDLADLVCDTLKPVQDKYADLMNNKDYLEDIMAKNALKAKERANKTLIDVYNKVGLYPGRR